MHAPSSYQNNGSKVTKIAIVTALHVAVGLAFISMQVIKPAAETPPPIDVTLAPPAPLIEQQVLEPVDATLPPPTIFVPRTDIVSPTPTDAPTATTFEAPIAPPVTTIAPVTAVLPTVAAEENPVAKKVFEVASAGNCAVPNYPANSARNGDTGTVGLALLISPDGRVADSRVTSSSGFRELDRAAVAALSSCKFKPATTNGVPEAAWGKIAYVWTLD